MDEFESIYFKVFQYTKAEKEKIAEQIAALETPAMKDQQEQKNAADERQNVEADGQPNDKANQPDNVKVAPNKKEAETTKKENSQLKALRERESRLPEPELLQTWYRLDENSVPAVYRLQPIK